MFTSTTSLVYFACLLSCIYGFGLNIKLNPDKVAEEEAKSDHISQQRHVARKAKHHTVTQTKMKSGHTPQVARLRKRSIESVNKKVNQGQKTLEFLKKHRQLLTTGVIAIIALIIVLTLYRKCCKSGNTSNGAESFRVVLMRANKSGHAEPLKQRAAEVGETVKTVEDMEKSSGATQDSGAKSTSLATGTAARTIQKNSPEMKATPRVSLADVCSAPSIENASLLWSSPAARISELSILELDKEPIGSACPELEPAILEMIPMSAYIVLPQVPLARVNLTGNQYESETRLLSDWLNRQHISRCYAQGKRAYH